MAGQALNEGIFREALHPRDRLGQWEHKFFHAGQQATLKAVPLVGEPDPAAPHLRRDMRPLAATEAYRRARLHGEAYLTAHTYHGDELMYDLARDRGFAGPPHVVSEGELDGLVAGGAVELWRGLSKRAYADAVLHGGYYAGYGYRGNGIYTLAGGEGARRHAAGYARGRARHDGSPSVLHLALDPAARVRDLGPLKAEAKRASRRWARVANDQGRSSGERRDAGIRLAVALDVGRFGMEQGVDAIRVSDDEYLVLNRTALHASSEVLAA